MQRKLDWCDMLALTDSHYEAIGTATTKTATLYPDNVVMTLLFDMGGMSRREVGYILLG